MYEKSQNIPRLVFLVHSSQTADHGVLVHSLDNNRHAL